MNVECLGTGIVKVHDTRSEVIVIAGYFHQRTTSGYIHNTRVVGGVPGPRQRRIRIHVNRRAILVGDRRCRQHAASPTGTNIRNRRVCVGKGTNTSY